MGRALASRHIIVARVSFRLLWSLLLVCSGTSVSISSLLKKTTFPNSNSTRTEPHKNHLGLHVVSSLSVIFFLINLSVNRHIFWSQAPSKEISTKARGVGVGVEICPVSHETNKN